MTLRSRRALAGLVLGLASCALPGPSRTPGASLARFVEEFFAGWVKLDPEWYAELRAFGDDVDPRGDLLNDVSLAAQQDRLRFARAGLARLSSYQPRRADPGLRAGAEALAWYLDDTLRGAPFQLNDYPVNPYDGEQLRLIAFMRDVHGIRTPRDAENYVVRLSRFGERIGQLIDGLRAREVRGVIPPRPLIVPVLEGLREFLAVPVRDNVLVTSFRARLEGVPGLSQPEILRLVEQAAARVADSVQPAYRALAGYVEQLEPKAPEQVGVWRLPNGDAYYAHLVRHYTTLERPPGELHELGLREVERLQAQLSGLLARLGFEAGSSADSLRAYLDSGSAAGLPPEAAGARAARLADWRARIEAAPRSFADAFVAWPRGPLVVEPFAAYREAEAPAAAYEPPSLDATRPGVLRVNLGRPVSLPALQVLVYREAIPGHHLQMALQREARDLPSFSRLVSFAAYTEGWAGYAQRLARERGLYRDPHAEIAQLRDELLRAARLVVDTGIHHERWWRRDALLWMRANLGDEHAREVDRTIARPGRALADKIGELHLLELRDRARQALGPHFDAPRFHAAVLAQGSLPLPVLDGVVERFLEAEAR